MTLTEVSARWGKHRRGPTKGVRLLSSRRPRAGQIVGPGRLGGGFAPHPHLPPTSRAVPSLAFLSPPASLVLSLRLFPHYRASPDAPPVAIAHDPSVAELR